MYIRSFAERDLLDQQYFALHHIPRAVLSSHSRKLMPEEKSSEHFPMISNLTAER